MKNGVLFAGLLITPAMFSVNQTGGQPPPAQPDPRLLRLEQFFAKRDCPLQGMASDFLLAADRNDLDWRLLPSISIVESSGGKDYRNNNVFGWGSKRRRRFESVQAGIQIVATRLATSKLYKDKNLDRLLRTYNPVPGYPKRVKSVMRTLAAEAELAMVN